ncbi:hypothetical protein Cni_G02610 [Canna indica]|uniref:Transposase n=1 Tax=Canna indica TaxID=4628 RepID=A0AAQ3Q2I0_9LILI|nr:hypothetical protein Cni_G02610 [Canna indica]
MNPEHREPSSWKMFYIAHTKSDASLNSIAAQEIVDKFKALAQESYSSTSTTEDEIYRQVVGPERHGRTRGYGLGPTPTTVFGTTPGRIELASQLRIANTQNAELKTKIDDLEKKIDDDRRKMEERMMEERMEMERKKMEEKMEEDRRKMQILLAFVEEMKTNKRLV